MGRITCVLWVLGGCYSPSPSQNLGCSETQRCPLGQSCDLLFDQCASLPLCATSDVSSAFTNVDDPCAPWGSAAGNGDINVDANGLELDPMADLSMGCQRGANDVMFTISGLWVEVTALPTGQGVVALIANADHYPPAIGAGGGMLNMYIDGGPAIASITYDPVAMRWWRLRPDLVNNATLGEYSADGIAWTLLGSTEMAPPDTVGPSIIATADDNDDGNATIRSFDVCPPGTSEPAP